MSEGDRGTRNIKAYHRRFSYRSRTILKLSVEEISQALILFEVFRHFIKVTTKDRGI